MTNFAKYVGSAPGDNGQSIVRGIALEEEPGIGSQTIGGYLQEVAERFGDAEAVVFNEGGKRLSWTYAELLERSIEVAKALVAGGLGKEERVGILMTNRPEFLSGFFGTALAGGVAVALSTFSTEEELDHLLASSGVSVLLFETQVLKKDFAAVLTTLEPFIDCDKSGRLSSERFPYLHRVVGLGASTHGAMESWQDFLRSGSCTSSECIGARAARVSPTDPGGIFFSSGTTSLPKGIAHDQRAFAIQWWRWPRVFAMREPVRSWTGNGFFWSGNISMVLGTALSTGGAVILQRFFDADEALRLIEEENVTFANGRPHQWARLQSAPGWADADLSSLRYVPRGELLEQHPTVSMDWQLPMSFGTTETMSICTSLDADVPVDDYQGSCGAPLPGNVLKIVDPITRSVVPVGQSGEMCIKGPTLMSGYLGKSAEQCFDPEGFYCTGDGGRVDAEGRFFWEGRLTAMIKTGGANVAPEEVDDIVGNWPGVKRSQTVGVADELLGEKVVCCIVPIDGQQVDLSGLEDLLKSRLASFKQPKSYLICTEEEFAITGNEKIKPAEIRAMAEKRLAKA